MGRDGTRVTATGADAGFDVSVLGRYAQSNLALFLGLTFQFFVHYAEYFTGNSFFRVKWLIRETGCSTAIQPTNDPISLDPVGVSRTFFFLLHIY